MSAKEKKTATSTSSSSFLFKSSATRVEDLKKKIALIEGQRKAIYTSLEKEKAKNREREMMIEEELLELKKDLVRSQSTKESLLDKVKLPAHMDR